MSEALLGFLSGVGVTLVGAYVANLLQRAEEKRRRVQENQLQVYLKLLDLYNQYFWIASLEMHGEEADSEMKKRIRTLAWQISDLLRMEDSVQHADEILRVLMSNEYSSASARHHAMGELLDKIGKKVNPTFQKVGKVLSNENVKSVGSGQRPATKSTTPGFLWPW